MGKSRRLSLPVVPALKLCSGLKGCTWCGAWNQELMAVGQADNLSCFFAIPRSVEMWIAQICALCLRGCASAAASLSGKIWFCEFFEGLTVCVTVPILMQIWPGRTFPTSSGLKSQGPSQAAKSRAHLEQQVFPQQSQDQEILYFAGRQHNKRARQQLCCNPIGSFSAASDLSGRCGVGMRCQEVNCFFEAMEILLKDTKGTAWTISLLDCHSWFNFVPGCGGGVSPETIISIRAGTTRRQAWEFGCSVRRLPWGFQSPARCLSHWQTSHSSQRLGMRGQKAVLVNVPSEVSMSTR